MNLTKPILYNPAEPQSGIHNIPFEKTDQLNILCLQGLKIALVHSYLRVSEAAGQVKILIFLLKIKLSTYISKFFVMLGKCLL